MKESVLSKTIAVVKLLVIILCIDIVCSFVFLGYSEIRYGGILEETGPTAAIVFWGDYERLTPVTQRRVNYALDLRRAGKISQFLCVGSGGRNEKANGAKVVSDILRQAGVPADIILTEQRRSNDTRSNLVQAKLLAQRVEANRVLLVSDPLHVMRMDIALSDRLLPVKAVPAALSFVHADPPVGLDELWWRVHYEWSAYLAYLLPEKVYVKAINVLRK